MRKLRKTEVNRDKIVVYYETVRKKCDKSVKKYDFSIAILFAFLTKEVILFLRRRKCCTNRVRKFSISLSVYIREFICSSNTKKNK